jgi:hypothetical protein
LKERGAKHDQGFDRPAPGTQVSVNLEIDVLGVWLDLRKSGLEAAYWARICCLGRERRIVKSHVLALSPMLVWRGLGRLTNRFFTVELKTRSFALALRGC